MIFFGKNKIKKIGKLVKKIRKLSNELHPSLPSECPDRVFIKNYLDINAQHIKGDILEFCGTTEYAEVYASDNDRVYKITGEKYKDLSVSKNADFYCDFEDEKTLPDKKFDCIIATQVLIYAVDLVQVMKNLKKMLKPNGYLIVTVSGTWAQHDSKAPFTYYFNCNGLKKLSEKVFGQGNISLKCYGNLQAAIHSLFWLKNNEMPTQDYDDRYLIIIGGCFFNKEDKDDI